MLFFREVRALLGAGRLEWFMLKRFAEILLGERGDSAQVSSPVKLPLATCVVLLEAACADESFSREERRHILEVLVDRFDLTKDEASEMLEEATRASEHSVGLHRFTRAVNEGFTPAEKRDLIEEVWRIFYSDGTLTGHEDHLAHQLGKLLNLNHPQLIDAKMKVLEAVRRGESSGG